MTCSDVERILPELMDGVDSPEFQAHLKACPDCSELVTELNLIASEARQLAASDEPPARVWVSIANQLRAEGIIREPETAPARPVLVPSDQRQRRWSPWWLAPVAAAILAAGSYQLAHRQVPVAPQTVAQESTTRAVQPSPAAPSNSQVAQAPAKTSPTAPTKQAASQPAVSSAPHPIENLPAEAVISPPADDDRFLSEVSQRAPSMRATYENQLRAVNAEIRETQVYISQHPGDLDARQHLMEAYQQKAMLYQMALDHIQ